jgi:hypothetical protein
MYFLRSAINQMLTISETTDSTPLSEPERRLAVITEESLTQSCFEDIFIDSKFLKQGSENVPAHVSSCVVTRQHATTNVCNMFGCFISHQMP